MAAPKIPPHAAEAEQSVLGAILLSREAIVKVVEFLRPEHFYELAHQSIFESVLELYERREPLDVLTLADRLKKKKKLTAAGGSAYLAELVESVPTASHVEHYGRMVEDAWTKRQLIEVSSTMNELAFDETREVVDILDEVEQRVFTLSKQRARQDFISVKEALAESFDRLDELQRSQSGLRGVATGFVDLDRALAGMQKSNLLILAARPGIGKTSLAINISQYAAVANQVPVGFFALEMSQEEMVDRMLIAQADIDAWKFKTGRFSDEDFNALSEAMGILAEAPLFIDDTPALSVMEMRTKARKLKAEHDIGLLVVDYLQLARARNLENRVQEVTEISQGLKNLARELKLPVLALSQLSRAVEHRGSSRPQLADLRESGAIEQDSDVVMFLYREDEEDRENVILDIQKHRNGPLRSINLHFRGDRIRFYGVDRKAAAPVAVPPVAKTAPAAKAKRSARKKTAAPSPHHRGKKKS